MFENLKHLGKLDDLITSLKINIFRKKNQHNFLIFYLCLVLIFWALIF